MTTYFLVYQTRHYGWMASKTYYVTAQETANNEDNMDTFACMTSDPLNWPNDALLHLSDESIDVISELEPWNITQVHASIINGELEVTLVS